MSEIGHNKGPTMEPGAGWRRFAWRKARADLLPKLPIEVVRLRVKRARELGLDYKSYASIRAANGRDVVAFLFSSNALRVVPASAAVAPARAEKLLALKQCERLAFVQPPLSPELVLQMNPEILEATGPAPTLLDNWPAISAKVANLTIDRGVPRDGVVVIGDAALDREWLLAGRLAGYVPAERYFGATP